MLTPQAVKIKDKFFYHIHTVVKIDWYKYNHKSST